MEFLRIQLRQCFVIIRSAWQRALTYRTMVFMYRAGELVEIIVLVTMWTAIYAGTELVKGFTLSEMITYVLIGNLFAVIIRNFVPSFVARDISEGRLSMFLVKPISYPKFIFFNEIGRAGLAVLFSVLTQILVIAFFLDKIIINTSLVYWAVLACMILLAFIIEFQLGFLIGIIAFWSDEVDAIQTSLERVKRFFSGGYFPLSLLPASLATASIYLPFAYSFFMPAQLYLKKISIDQALQGIGIQIVWILLLWVVCLYTWKKGLRKYEASGS